MQLTLVPAPDSPTGWALGLASRLGIRTGDWIPVGDPEFLRQLAEALGIAPGPGALASAAGLLALELGAEVRASPASLAAAGLAIEVAAAASDRLRQLASTGAASLAALEECLERTAALLVHARPQRPDRQHQLVERAVAPLSRLLAVYGVGPPGSGSLAA